ncbi:hypothetical protein [Staphylococcus carnosus]|uniref:hypothetical protein n=1 Tax=Staphylococcus carnosus TaxID=1281 RepID=UPI00081A8A71|nr:hypothetical protein [Staphylococcus carnosus]ANZ33888.1 hypothetical protein BEK99_08855 [Staphylococcus carnosus]UTB86069.1 hypothetical protein A2I66_10455 [Staphylococcus carnosus]
MSYEVDYIPWLEHERKRLTFRNKKIRAESDSLIDDIAVLKANNDRYRNRAENAMEYAERSQCEVLRLERENKSLKNENKAIHSQSNSYFDEWQNEQTTSRGLREQCKEYAEDASKYLCLTEHIRLKAEINPSVDRYINLVNYIDKLEGGENEV